MFFHLPTPSPKKPEPEPHKIEGELSDAAQHAWAEQGLEDMKPFLRKQAAFKAWLAVHGRT